MLRPLGTATAMTADVMARLAAVETKADDAATTAQAANNTALGAEARAEQAEATGQNARQMVLNDRPKISTAEQTAAAAKATADSIDVKRGEYEAALSASITDRAAIHAQLNTLAGDTAATKTAIDRLTASIGKPDAIGARPVGAVILNGSTTVTVPLSRPMPNLGYRIEMAHSAVVTLAAGMLTETARTTTTVTVKITGVGIALVAGTLVVVAREG